MRIFGKVLISFLFSVFFSVFVLLGTIRFEILNKDFLFSSFDRNKVYERLPKVLAESLPNDPNLSEEERVEYTKIASSVNIKPEAVKKVLESNLSQFIDLLDGKNKEIKIFIPAKDLGLPIAQDINWSSEDRFSKAFGGGFGILIGWVITLLILAGMVWFGGKHLLLVGGIYLTLIGILGRLFCLVLEKTLPQKLEPAQALLKLLATSLLPEIFISWVIVGICLIIFWVVLTKFKNSGHY